MCNALLFIAMRTNLMSMGIHLASWPYIPSPLHKDVRGEGALEALAHTDHCSSARETFSIGNCPGVRSLVVSTAWRTHVLTLTWVCNLPRVQYTPCQKPTLL
jgi:hypothetical protein